MPLRSNRLGQTLQTVEKQTWLYYVNYGTIAGHTNFVTGGSHSLIQSVEISTASAGGFKTWQDTIKPWLDTSKQLEMLVKIQNAGGAAGSGDVVMQGHYTLSRNGVDGITNVSLSSVTIAGPADNAGQLEVSLGTIAAGTFLPGDLVALAVQRIGSDGSDDYDQNTHIAKSIDLAISRR